MTYLLDVNVLIALGDSSHVHHDRTQSWFHSESRAWATCPLTENAFLRIVGGAGYPTVSEDPEGLRPVLAHMCAWPGHQFWPDAVSMLDTKAFPRLATSNNLTDLYLLGLAISHDGSLATFDQRIDPSLIPSGQQAYYLIP